MDGDNMGALIIRTEFWDALYYTYHKEPHNSIGDSFGPCFDYA